MGPRRKTLVKAAICLSVIVALGFLPAERKVIPVMGASTEDWNNESFWYEPWGSSGVHKGIDIFGESATDVVSTVDGTVVFSGSIAKGGNVVLVLGPNWRLHYFAHMDTTLASPLELLSSGEKIGTLGSTGNAQGKPPHLHYSIVRLIPAPWEMDSSTQGYKKAFFIDPNRYLRE